MEGIGLFSIAILVMSVVIHEIAHGYMALAFGDTTAKFAGRLTLNPIKHIDFIGSIIIPLILIILPGGFVFGWAKPVPYNPYNFSKRRLGELLVALAGPASNILLALVFSIVIRMSEVWNISQSMVDISVMVVLINLVLAVFNLIPVPPLDGSKVLYFIFPQLANWLEKAVRSYGLIFIFLAFLLFVSIINVVIGLLFYLFTGLKVI